MPAEFEFESVQVQPAHVSCATNQCSYGAGVVASDNEYIVVNGSKEMPIKTTLFCLRSIHVDFDNMDADVDLSDWIPANVMSGATITIRKIDSSPFKISYTDSTGVVYRYIDRQGEILTLQFFKPSIMRIL